MRFRSTGMGNTELKGYLQGLRLSEKGNLVADFQTTEPVKWHLGAALEPGDIPKLVGVIFKPSFVFKTAQAVLWKKKNPKEPKDLMSKEWPELNPPKKEDPKGK